MLQTLTYKVISGGSLTPSEAAWLNSHESVVLADIFSAASAIRRCFRGDSADLCAIVNAKSGACSEDCGYCSQSARSATGISVYPLLEKNRVVEKALEAKNAGVRRFCIVTSGRKVGKGELKMIGAMVSEIALSGLLPCATLGLMDREELAYLKECGLVRYHHNLETSRRYFPSICSTHTFDDKLRTIEAAQAAGLSVCSGGIFGIGESAQDRIDMAFELRKIGADSVPVNFLIPVKGTPMEARPLLPPLEALKIVSLYRFILPDRQVRVCGGRLQALGEHNSMVFQAGADAILTGNYLTTAGRTFSDDVELIRQNGLSLC